MNSPRDQSDDRLSSRLRQDQASRRTDQARRRDPKQESRRDKADDRTPPTSAALRLEQTGRDPSMPQRGITIKSKWYAGFAFDSDASSIDYEDDVLSLRDADRQTVATVHVRDLDEMTTKRGTFSNELRVSSRNRKTWVCRGMQSGPSTKLTRIVQRRIHYHRIEEAKPISRKVAPKILEMRARLGHWLTGHDRYRRRSETDPLSADIQGVLSRCDKHVIECLDSQATRELQQLTKFGAPNTLEKARQHTNRSYLEKTIPQVLASAQQTFRRKLTEEHAEAVSTDEDATLVLQPRFAGSTHVADHPGS